MLYIQEKFKTFFNKLEIGGAASHLILLLYFVLNYQLYKVIVDTDKETSSSMVNVRTFTILLEKNFGHIAAVF